MPTIGPIRLKIKLGVLIGSSGTHATLTPIKLKLTLGTLIGRSGPRVGHLTPIRLKYTLGRLRGIEHDVGTSPVINEANYNGTTYRIEMTGDHLGLPTLIFQARTVEAEEGGIHETRAVTEFLPVIPPVDPGPGVPPIIPTHGPIVGLATSSDYGTGTAVIGRTERAQGSTIVTVAMTDDPTGNVYSTHLNTGGLLYLFRHLMTGTTQQLVSATLLPFAVPPIQQIRTIPGVGFAVVTGAGFYFFNTALTVMEPRNSGIVDVTGGQGQLSVLSDGSLIIYGGDRLYKSIDLGHRWIDASGNLPPFFTMKIYDVYAASATHWYLATNVGVWKTTNSGTTWALVNSNINVYGGFATRDVEAFSVHGSASNANTVIVGLRGKVARTTNGGATWTVFGKTEGLGAKPARYRVHQAGTVLLAAYGDLYEFVPAAYIWRSEDNGASWQVAFPGTSTSYVNDLASASGFSFEPDLVAIATNKGTPADGDNPDNPRPWVRTVTSYHEVFKRSSLVAVTANVDAATLAGISARAVIVGEKRARVLVRQIKDYRNQRRTDIIASGVYRTVEIGTTSLSGLRDITITARDTNVQQQFHRNKVARVIPDSGVVVGAEEQGGDLVLSMLIDETIRPQNKISWLGTEYIISGIKYAISEGNRLMSLNTKVRTFSVPTSIVRDGNTKRLPVYVPPRATGWKAKFRR